MSLKIQIKRAMFSEGIEDRMQDIATLIDMPVEDVDKRLKTLSFSDYIEVMTSLRQKNEDTIKRIMGLDVDESKISEDREDRTDVADRLADLANSQITDYFTSEDELHDFMYSELTSDEDYHDGGKTLDWAMGRVNDDVKAWIDEGVDEAYSTGSQGSGGTIAPDDEEEEEIAGTVDMPMTSQDNQKVKSARTQAMQRLGRDNLGGATAQQTADAMDKAGQGKALTPIQRRSMAAQTQNLDNLATNPQTRMQFKNLLNKLRMQQSNQEG
jgi:hypothetical protein